MTSDQWCSSGCNSRVSLFNVCISGLDAEVECMVSKSVENSKLGGAVDSFRGQEALYRDLDKLEHCVIIHGMQFDKSKCRVLHLGCSSSRHKSRLGEEWLHRRSGGAGWQEAQQEPAVCALLARKANLILECTKHHQRVKTNYYPAVFSTNVVSP